LPSVFSFFLGQCQKGKMLTIEGNAANEKANRAKHIDVIIPA
jgi:hypothetical protein